MGRIVILPDAVADQIAAGEVVERPGSVVKELIENALDAGAKRISVTLESGGGRSITVADDGHGMSREDAVLALDRHATSKVRTADDLIGIVTYGFRGEALPSIASVSKFELETAEANAVAATRVSVEGGTVLRVEESARQTGTTVTVNRLFFNAPARRKFLRSQAAETRAATQMLTSLAMTRPDVGFSLVSDGRKLIDAEPTESHIDRLAALFGQSLISTLIPVEYTKRSVSVRGFVQRPADAKPAGRRAHLFVNGRPFKDPFLVRAAEAGYRATIHPGCRPTMFLWLEVEGDMVDVNVHPAKLEVRFRERRLIEGVVVGAIRGALGEMESAAHVRPPLGQDPLHSSAQREWDDAARASNGHENVPSLFEATAGSEHAPVAPARLDGPTSVLQVFATYLICETAEGVTIVDQHSAHERVLYEEAMHALNGGGAASQRLLIPITIDLDSAELQAIEEEGDIFERVGFVIDPFGGNSILIHAVPNPHPRFDAKRCFEEMVADLARGRFGGWTNKLERFAATYACRAAIKAGQNMAPDEIKTLLRDLSACELPPHDVHGRPTMVQLPRAELERRFGRS